MILSANAVFPNVELFCALESRKDPGLVQKMVDSGADVNAKNKMDSIPLHEAVLFGPDPEIIWILLEAGADVNQMDGHWASLRFISPWDETRTWRLFRC